MTIPGEIWPKYPVGEPKPIGLSRPGSNWLFPFTLDLTANPDAATLWLNGSTAKNSAQQKPLIDVIGDHGYPDERFAGTGQYDGARIGRPYPHFALVGPTSEDHHAVCAQLKEFFLASFGELAEIPPRLRFFPSSFVTQNTLYFGPGIFVPEPDAKPIGRLSLRGAGDWVSPFLIRNQDTQEAGFYAGQRGLVAATWHNEAPALLDLGTLAQGRDVEHFSVFLGASEASARPRVGLHKGLGVATKLQMTTEVSLAELDTDEGVPLTLPDQRVHLRYEADIRPFRLSSTLPDGPALALMGIALPAGQPGLKLSEPVETLLEFDENMVPVTKPLHPRRYTLEAKGGGLNWQKPEIYDWTSRKWRTPSDAKLELTWYKLPGLCNCWMASRAEKLPFGFVDLDRLGRATHSLGALLDCTGVIKRNTSFQSWSDVFSGPNELTFEQDGRHLMISDPSGLDHLETRVFLPGNQFPKDPAASAKQTSVRIEPGHLVVIGGMVWRYQLPERSGQRV